MKRPACLAILAVATVALPATLASGDSSGNGLSLSPPTIERVAKAGSIGSITVSNTTGQTLAINVSARPWKQAASGAVAPDLKRVLGPIRLGATSFTLASGSSRQVAISLTAVPSSGSVYGSYDVIGAPTQPKRNAVVFDYRLVGTLRLDPAAPRLAAAAGKVVETGTRRRGELYLAVRNTGNSIMPIGGSVRVRGTSAAASSRLTARAIVPGATVNLPALVLRGSLPAGPYTLTATLSAGAHTLGHATRRFRLR
jgi:hypothetical protein